MDRALLAVSIVALVFVLSIDDASGERRLLEDLQRLEGLAGPVYEEFVERRIEAQVGKELEARAAFVAESLEQGLGEQELRVLGASQIAEVFGRPVHVGRLRPEDLVLGDPDASLEEMDRLFEELPVDRDVQVVIAKTRDVVPGILQFAEDSALPGLLGPEVGQIHGVRLYSVLDASETAETFVPTHIDPTPLLLTFEYRRGAGMSAPIFEGDVDGELLVLPRSSWLHWLTEVGGDGDLVGRIGERRQWMPQVEDEERRTMSLAKLRGVVEQEVRRARADYQTISLPGVSVPGSLALIAIPAAFLGLLLTFTAHLQHLRRVVAGNERTFREFLWTPLSPSGASALAAFVLPTIVLPASVLVFLAFKAGAFDGPRSLGVVWCLVATVGIVAVGLAALRHLALLHARVHSRQPPSPEAAGDL